VLQAAIASLQAEEDIDWIEVTVVSNVSNVSPARRSLPSIEPLPSPSHARPNKRSSS
jgi:hypothetical protein